MTTPSEDALDRACRAWAAADPAGPRELSTYSYLGALTLRTRMRTALTAATPETTSAQTLRDAADRLDTMMYGPAAAPYVSAIKARLRAEADTLEDQ